MQTDDARDRAFERALQRSLTGPGPVPAGECVDAETLAAWTAGGLGAAQAMSVEIHLSSCPECQTLLAMFARATPALPAATPLWRRWRLNVFVPLVTAAATVALAVWLGGPGREPAKAPAPQQDERAAAQLAPISPPTSALPSTGGEPAAAVPQAGRLRADAGKSEARNAAPTPDQARAAVADRLLKETQAKAAADSDRQLTARADAPAPAAGPIPVLADKLNRDAALAEEAKTALASRPAAGPAPSPAAVSPAPAAPGGTTAASAAPAAARREQLAVAQQGRSFGATFIEVASPSSATRWRIAPGGGIEYFASAASGWRGTDIPPATPITAASSPADSICWMVGRGGIVYVTTDGLHFVRLTSPDPADLIAIRATDARTATVTSATGRTFQTSDAGKTWK